MTVRRTAPAVYLVLMLPFGVMGGYLTVAVAYQLSHAGLSVEAIAALVAASYIPHTWKFLWAPIADTTLKRKTWYLLGRRRERCGNLGDGRRPRRGALRSAALRGGHRLESGGHFPRDVGREPDGLRHASRAAGTRSRMVPGRQSRWIRARRRRRPVDGRASSRALDCRDGAGGRERAVLCCARSSFPSRRPCFERAAIGSGSARC